MIVISKDPIMRSAAQGVNAQVGSEGYWGSVVTYAIRTGFSGALSTVSTFVAEVRPDKPTLQCSSPHIYLAQAFAAQERIMQMPPMAPAEGILAVLAGAGSTEDGAREIAGVYLLSGIFADGSSAGCHCIRKHGLGQLIYKFSNGREDLNHGESRCCTALDEIALFESAIDSPVLIAIERKQIFPTIGNGEGCKNIIHSVVPIRADCRLQIACDIATHTSVTLLVVIHGV